MFCAHNLIKPSGLVQYPVRDRIVVGEMASYAAVIFIFWLPCFLFVWSLIRFRPLRNWMTEWEAWGWKAAEEVDRPPTYCYSIYDGCRRTSYTFKSWSITLPISKTRFQRKPPFLLMIFNRDRRQKRTKYHFSNQIEKMTRGFKRVWRTYIFSLRQVFWHVKLLFYY